MVVNGLRNYNPACDCHKYKNRFCNRCGYSAQEWEFMNRNTKEEIKEKSGIKNKSVFGANGIIKKRTIYD